MRDGDRGEISARWRILRLTTRPKNRKQRVVFGEQAVAATAAAFGKIKTHLQYAVIIHCLSFADVRGRDCVSNVNLIGHLINTCACLYLCV